MNNKKEEEVKMFKKTKIVCPSCGKDTGFTQDQFSYNLTEDIECPHCFEVVIKGSGDHD